MRPDGRASVGSVAARPDETVRWRVGRDVLLAPGDDGAGRALGAVIAVLAFMAVLAAGAAALVTTVSDAWRTRVSREATILIRPTPGRDQEADVARALALARAEPGIADARSFSRAESERLLEPWLGQGLDLTELPVPRMIVVRLHPDRPFDLTGFGARLQRATPGASTDDGAAWLARLSEVARSAVAGAIGLVALVLGAAGLAVAFATRGVMAGNRDVVDVLHVMGASDGFIALEFVRRFARLGLVSGLVGGLGAALVLALCRWRFGSVSSERSVDDLEAGIGLLDGGILDFGWPGTLAALSLAAAVSGISALASWTAVKRFLRQTY